ncbi:MAG TPA: carboxypeptidase regulatory-like domain-containing protein [Blastocatellia bacterium]|nr:carboxypeptidase regulatory-like domain-containing protein [Blastocatellia bacterium]
MHMRSHSEGLIRNSSPHPFVRGRVLFCLVSLVAALSLLSSVALGQVATGATVRGVVRDQNGAVVVKADVTLINQATKFERKTTSSSDGVYTFTAIDPGAYTLKSEANGFKTYQETDIHLNPGDAVGMDIVLNVGTASETITVQAATEQIQTETGAKEDTISSKQIDNLSIISRSSLELLRILPGVVAPNLDDPSFESLSFGGGANANANYNVNGLRGVENNVQVDGSRVMDIGSNNGTMITANPDMVQEVKVQTSNYAAEHGSSGVNISATTKGGSSEFHGEGYDYIRNHALNANDRSNTLFGVAKPLSTFQFPGGNISGPIILPGTKFNRNRDKLFFFFGVEVQRQSVDPGATFDHVPTAAERGGDFSKSFSGSIKDPYSGKAFAGNILPSNLIDPIGKALISEYPLPNFVSADPTSRVNYVADVLAPINRTQGIIRLDYNISSNTKMYVRLTREHESDDMPKGLWFSPSAYELPSHIVGTNAGKSISVNLTNVINPTMTNEVLFSGSRLLLDNNYADPSKVTLSALGLSNLKGPFGQINQVAPVALITSWGGASTGDLWEPGGMGLFAHNDSTSITDNLAKVHGSHTLKFGATIERATKQQNFNADPEGRFIYATWGNHSTGNEFADILTGHPAQYTQTNGASKIGSFLFWNVEGYAQDSWKIRSNFTLEYGLRIAYLPNNYEVNGLGVVFDPTTYQKGQPALLNNNPNTLNGMLTASSGAIPKGFVGNNPPQLMPRLNFAWDINGKGDTVIRGGAGLFYNRVQGNYQYYSINHPPNLLGPTFDGYSFGSLNNNTGLTYNNLPLITQPLSNSTLALGIQSANLQSNRIPRIATMSLSIARRLPKNTILEVAYVGTEGRHLPDLRHNALDSIPIGTLLSGHVGDANLADPVERWAVAGQAAVLNQFRPFPAYTGIDLFEYNATSSYHSLQATLSHQAGKNLQFFATYTFSKALGVTGVNETDGNGVDPVDIRNRNWGVLPFDRTHIFNLSYNYNIPNLARGFLGGNALTRGLLNGWQMSGISTLQSGVPIRLKFSGDLAGVNAAVAFFGSDAFGVSSTQSGAISPVFTGNPTISGSSKFGGTILDLSKIQIPAFGTSGPYVPAFYIRSPHRQDHDISFFKNFRITENKKLQFRAGFFDIFNQAYPRYNLGNQGTSDVFTTIDTVCNHFVNNVPNGTASGTSNNICDPTQGFHIAGKADGGHQDTIDQFGKIINKHGHRTIELALKFMF